MTEPAASVQVTVLPGLIVTDEGTKKFPPDPTLTAAVVADELASTTTVPLMPVVGVPWKEQ